MSLNPSLPATRRVAVPNDVMTQALVAGVFVQRVGKAAIAAHEDLKA
jgi:hypothetical protein